MSGITDHLEIELREAREAGAELDHLLQAVRRVYGDTALRTAVAEAAQMAFDDEASDPLAQHPEDTEFNLSWNIAAYGTSPAAAAASLWRDYFDDSGLQPAQDRACVFTVHFDAHGLEIDLSDQQFAHLFQDSTLDEEDRHV